MALIIRKRSHHFLVTQLDGTTRPAIEDYCKGLIQWGVVREGRRFFRKPLKVFAASVSDRSEFRFHINFFEEFINFLASRGVVERDYTIVDEPASRGAAANYQIADGWMPRENQKPGIAYVKSDEPPRAKLLGLATGQGKSYSAMQATADIGTRTLYIMRPMYMDKWHGDFEKTYAPGHNNSVMVKGLGQLRQLFALASAGELTFDNIVISNKTYQLWLAEYEQHGEHLLDQGWDIFPDQMYQHLQIDTLVIDELHLDFHLNFKVYLYANVHKSIALTGTLLSDDAFITRIQERIHPHQTRHNGDGMKSYIDTSAYMYQFEHMGPIQTKEYGDNKYSHHAFERSVLRNPKALDGYFRMIETILYVDFFDIRDDDETAIVFCASVKMCEVLTKWLSKRHPDFSIKYYVQGGEYDDDFIDSDIVVTTVGKSGTAVDKPMLRTNILTNAISSTASNRQIFGRLRELKASGNTPRFIYLTCSDIPKHVEYHDKKVQILKPISRNFKIRHHDSIILTLK